MDIRQLEYYSTLVRKGSFTRAADELFVTRQALSKAVKNLEHELGDRLVIVRNGRVQPTEVGSNLYAEAAPVIDSYRKLEGHFVPHTELHARAMSLSIALGHGSLLSLPDGYLELFRCAHPNVRLSIEEMPTESVLDLVAESEVDIGIVGSTPDYLAAFEHKLLVKTGLFLSIPRDNPLAEKERLTMRDVDGVPFVTYGKRNHLHRFFMEECKSSGVYPDILLTTSDCDMLVQSAQASDALYFCFPEVTEYQAAYGRVIRPLDTPSQSAFGTYAIIRKELPAASSAKLFWDWAE